MTQAPQMDIIGIGVMGGDYPIRLAEIDVKKMVAYLESVEPDTITVLRDMGWGNILDDIDHIDPADAEIFAAEMISTHAQLDHSLAEEVEAGGKLYMNKEQFDRINAMMQAIGCAHAPDAGGSTGNSMYGIAAATQQTQTPLDVGMVSYSGKGGISQVSRASLADANVWLMPQKLNDGRQENIPQINLVVTNSEGKRCSISYPGFPGHHIAPEMWQQLAQGRTPKDFSREEVDALRGAKVIAINGSVVDKWNNAAMLMGAIDFAHSERGKERQAFALFAPKAAYVHDARTGIDNRPLFQQAIAHSDLIAGNAEELGVIYGITPRRGQKELDAGQTEKLTTKLQQAMGEEAVIFMTRGMAGSRVITKHYHEDIGMIPATEKVGEIGAGDAYAAGAFAGLLSGLNPILSAQVGAKLSSMTVEVINARIPQERFGEIGQFVEQQMAAQKQINHFQADNIAAAREQMAQSDDVAQAASVLIHAPHPLAPVASA